MKPLTWIRWKVLGVVVALGVLLYVVGAAPFVLREVNALGTTRDDANWNIGDLSLGLFGGQLALENLFVATRSTGAAEQDDVFSAEHAALDLSVSALTRRQYVVESVELQMPELTLRRRPEGGTGRDAEGGDVPTASKSPGEGDWLQVAWDWYEKLRSLRERIPGVGDEPGEPGSEESSERDGRGQGGFTADYSRGVTYPYDTRPGFLVRKLAARGLSIDFVEESGSDRPSVTHLARLVDGYVDISELSSAPALQENATVIEVGGAFAGAPVRLLATVDLRRGNDGLFDLEFESGAIGTDVLTAFFGDSLPVRLVSGVVAVKATTRLRGESELLVSPHLTFEGLRIAAKEGSTTLAGFPAARVVAEFNKSSELLDRVVIDDLRITGSPGAPQFEWGSTLRDIVTQGASAFANRQVAAGKARLRAEIDARTAQVRAELEQSATSAADVVKERTRAELEKRGIDSEEKAKEVLEEGARGALESLRGRFFGSESGGTDE